MTDSPLLETRLTILPEGLDENSHITTNGYLPAFDPATEKFVRQLQIDWTYANGKLSLFALGMNIDFHNELRLEDNLSISTFSRPTFDLSSSNEFRKYCTSLSVIT